MPAKPAKSRRTADGRRPRWVVRQSELAGLLASDARTVRAWETAGMPAEGKGAGKRYDLRQVLPWLKARWLGGADDCPGADGLPSKRSAEIKVLIAREARLRLQTELTAGRWIPRDEVRRADLRKVAAFRAALEALSRQLAPAIVELGGEPGIDEVEAAIRRHVHAILRVCAGDG